MFSAFFKFTNIFKTFALKSLNILSLFQNITNKTKKIKIFTFLIIKFKTFSILINV